MVSLLWRCGEASLYRQSLPRDYYGDFAVAPAQTGQAQETPGIVCIINADTIIGSVVEMFDFSGFDPAGNLAPTRARDSLLTR
jgi:hypothetical protein